MTDEQITKLEDSTRKLNLSLQNLTLAMNRVAAVSQKLTAQLGEYAEYLKTQETNRLTRPRNA